ncbi:MAG TPA: oxidoreductase, partial [Caballeronia sp.]|nr:oxidoreductase [Caballeronia sp.]
IELRTIDDYSYTVSAREAERYGAILAYSMNGVRLTVSKFGPLFLIYPRDAYPSELSGSAAEAKFVWQIKGMVVK